MQVIPVASSTPIPLPPYHPTTTKKKCKKERRWFHLPDEKVFFLSFSLPFLSDINKADLWVWASFNLIIFYHSRTQIVCLSFSPLSALIYIWYCGWQSTRPQSVLCVRNCDFHRFWRMDIVLANLQSKFILVFDLQPFNAEFWCVWLLQLKHAIPVIFCIFISFFLDDSGYSCKTNIGKLEILCM